jgi:hypothetical protein
MAVIIKGGPWLASVFLTLLGGIAAAQDDELKTPVGEEQADEVVEEIIVVGSRPALIARPTTRATDGHGRIFVVSAPNAPWSCSTVVGCHRPASVQPLISTISRRR